jgi:hypothetical protein
LSPTARVEGAQFHRVASASKGDDPDYLRPHSFELINPLC